MKHLTMMLLTFVYYIFLIKNHILILNYYIEFLFYSILQINLIFVNLINFNFIIFIILFQ
jgi:hypothetical protein